MRPGQISSAGMMVSIGNLIPVACISPLSTTLGPETSGLKNETLEKKEDEEEELF